MPVCDIYVHAFLALCALATVNVVTVTGSNMSVYRHVPSFDAYLPNMAYTSRVSARSTSECGVICAEDVACQSFFYVKSVALSCQLHSTALQLRHFSTVQLDFIDDSRHFTYFDTDVSTTSSTTTTTTPAPSTTTEFTVTCPVDGSGFVKAMLPDSTTFYIGFKSATQTAAETYNICIRKGARLPLITTVDKMNFYRNFVTNCSSLSGYNFWVDGSNENANNFFAADAWTTSFSTQLPMTSDFWYPSRPNNAGLSHCIWIAQDKDYYFDDINCATASAVSVMCETDSLNNVLTPDQGL